MPPAIMDALHGCQAHHGHAMAAEPVVLGALVIVEPAIWPLSQHGTHHGSQSHYIPTTYHR
jgi:hypothetical protein